MISPNRGVGAVQLRLRRAGAGTAFCVLTQSGRMEPFGQAALDFEITCATGTPAPMCWRRSCAALTENSCAALANLPWRTRQAQGAGAREARDRFDGAALIDGPAAATDGDPATVWQANGSQPAWLVVDLESVRSLSRVRIEWGFLYAVGFAVQLSSDGQSWSEVHLEKAGRGGASDISFAPRTARFIRVQCKQRC
jgi:hypothetical protein